jgi:hypothetical protein
MQPTYSTNGSEWFDSNVHKAEYWKVEAESRVVIQGRCHIANKNSLYRR